MPLDNNGQPFQHISITTLEATSDPIILPFSRPVGFDCRLIYPMPHPFGAIGERRPHTSFVINTGPRPNAPINPKPRSLASQLHLSYGRPAPTGPRADLVPATSLIEPLAPVRPTQSPNLTEERLTNPAATAATAERKERQQEQGPPVQGNARVIEGQVAVDIGRHITASPTQKKENGLENSIEDAEAAVEKTNSTPDTTTGSISHIKIKFPQKQQPTRTTASRPSSARCSTHSTLSAPQPQCQACIFLSTLKSTSGALLVISEAEINRVEKKSTPPNHTQTTLCTDHGLPDFDPPFTATTSTTFPWLRTFLNPVAIKFPDLSADVHRLRRMARSREDFQQRRKEESGNETMRKEHVFGRKEQPRGATESQDDTRTKGKIEEERRIEIEEIRRKIRQIRR